MSTREATTADDPVIESLDQLTLPMVGGDARILPEGAV